MQRALEQTAERLQEAERMAAALVPADGTGAARLLAGRLGQLAALCRSAEGRSVGDLRSQIAGIRTALPELRTQAEQLQGNVAGAYRTVLGAAKDSFEAMSSADQEENHPDAYRLLHSYGNTKQLADALEELNASLLDASGAIESQALEKRPPVEIGEVETYDNDPAPFPPYPG